MMKKNTSLTALISAMGEFSCQADILSGMRDKRIEHYRISSSKVSCNFYWEKIIEDLES